MWPFLCVPSLPFVKHYHTARREETLEVRMGGASEPSRFLGSSHVPSYTRRKPRPGTERADTQIRWDSGTDVQVGVLVHILR